MCRHNRVLRRLKNLAEDIDLIANARVAAAIHIGGKEIAVGMNQSKTHPLAEQFQKHPEAILLHAEIHAIHNALKRVDVEDLKRATLYVARAKYDNPTKDFMVAGLAKPCNGCQQAIEVYGIKRVYYTDDNYNFSCDTPLTLT